MKSRFLLLSTLVVATTPVVAQERTAAGAAETQMTWSALQTQIGTLTTQNKAITFSMDKLLLCNGKSKFFAPNNPAKDADGCVGIAVNELKFKTSSYGTQNSCAGAHTCRADEATAEKLCTNKGHNGVSGYGTSSYKSPGDNTIGHWNGSSFVKLGAKASGNRWISSLTCYTFSYGPAK